MYKIYEELRPKENESYAEYFLRMRQNPMMDCYCPKRAKGEKCLLDDTIKQYWLENQEDKNDK